MHRVGLTCHSLVCLTHACGSWFPSKAYLKFVILKKSSVESKMLITRRSQPTPQANGKNGAISVRSLLPSKICVLVEGSACHVNDEWMNGRSQYVAWVDVCPMHQFSKSMGKITWSRSVWKHHLKKSISRKIIEHVHCFPGHTNRQRGIQEISSQGSGLAEAKMEVRN